MGKKFLSENSRLAKVQSAYKILEPTFNSRPEANNTRKYLFGLRNVPFQFPGSLAKHFIVHNILYIHFRYFIRCTF